MRIHRLNTWRSAARSRLSRPLRRHHTRAYTLRPQPVLVFYGPYLGQVSRHRCGAYPDANRLGPHDTCQYCTPLPIIMLDRTDVDWEALDRAEADSATTLETYGLASDGTTDAKAPRQFSVLTSWLTAYLAREWQTTRKDFEATYRYDDSWRILEDAERCPVRKTALRIW